MKEALIDLLDDLDHAYDQSDIKQACIANGHEWSYSLVTTKLIPNQPLIVGFNWGAAAGESYSPQSAIEYKGFDDGDTGSLVRIKPFCRQYFREDFLESASQSNYCLFRSHKQGEITRKDIELCEPIFQRLVAVLQPSLMLCLSSKLRDYLLSTKRIGDMQQKRINFPMGPQNVGYTAIKGRMGAVPFLSLPHPNYAMTKEARQSAWEFCCAHSSFT